MMMMMMMGDPKFEDLEFVDIRLATEEDMHIPGYDYTFLNNVNMCPVWGLIRYGLGKTYGTGRAMALEAGKAAHEVFAAIRLLELASGKGHDHFHHHGTRLFGKDRFEDMRRHLQREPRAIEDDREGWLNFALSALHSSGFYDDPRDRRRTIVSIEESCIAYFDRWQWGRWPVYVEDDNDPTCVVGIELPVNIIISFGGVKIRYTGRMDGFHIHGDHYNVHENKTGARMDESWRAGLMLSHQLTGYCVAANLMFDKPVWRATVFGMAIPLPRTYDMGGIVRDTYTRDQSRVHDWLKWVYETMLIVWRFESNPIDAPQHTHSCNRFFRACSFIEMCASPIEERQEFVDEMEFIPWDPLAEEEQK